MQVSFIIKFKYALSYRLKVTEFLCDGLMLLDGTHTYFAYVTLWLGSVHVKIP